MSDQRREQPWPDWWSWEIELTSHLEKRMEDRGFSEVELREMLERAEGYRPDDFDGRWVVTSSRRHTAWEIIVEPISSERVLVVITAYPL